MADFDFEDMSIEELEEARESIHASIEELRARFKKAGQVLEQKRMAASLNRDELLAQKADIEAKLALVDV